MCNRPIETIVTNGTRQKYIKYPCGKCLGCRIDKEKQWAQRCEYEQKKYVKSAFVTITYDDLHLNFKEKAVKPTLSREEFDKFIDRVTQATKKKYGKDFRYKFFASNEYGGLFKRPHAHILFFGLDFQEDRDLIKKCWKYGNIDCKPIKRGAIKYVVDYFSKEMVTGELAIKRYDSQGLERPFISHSQGLGRGLYFENRKQIQETGQLVIGQKQFKIPPYYRSLLSNYDSEETYKQTDTLHKEELKLKARALKEGYTNVKEYQKELGLCKERNLLEKIRRQGGIVDDREVF